MKVLFSPLLSGLLLLAVLLTSAANGYLSDLLQPGPLVAFLALFSALSVLTFGVSGLAQLCVAVAQMWRRPELANAVVVQQLGYAIRYSYVAAAVWLLAFIGNGALSAPGALMGAALADMAVALLYAVVMAELVLRPLRDKLALALSAKPA